jgi:hypothetical protein
MTMTPEQVAGLNARAQEVGAKIGWRLRFMPAPNPKYVGLIAGAEQIFAMGPAKLSDGGS